MTISTITIGGVDYQSYASVAEADAYLAVDPTRSAAWAALNTDTKGSYLVAATRRMDALRWSGSKVSSSQELQWPRSGVTDRDGNAVSETGIPQALEDATILVAGSVALDTNTANTASSGSNIKAVGAGSARVEFFRPTTGKALQDETAFALIQDFLAGDVEDGFGLASGTSGTSSFTDATDPGLTEGYP